VNGSPIGDPVRDLAVVRVHPPTGDKSVIYAVMNFGSVIEFDLNPPTTNPPPNPAVIATCGFPLRVAATTDGGAKSRIAVFSNGESGVIAESVAPFVVNGLWDGICYGTGIEDADAHNIPPHTNCTEIDFFEHDFNCTPSPCTFAAVAGSTIPQSAFASGRSQSLALHALANSNYRLYACSNYGATTVYDFAWGSPPTTTKTYVGNATPGQKAVVSARNPEIVRFGVEFAGKFNFEGNVVHIDATAPWAMNPIPVSQCTPPTPPLICAPNSGCQAHESGPSGANILGEGHWIDPDPSHSDGEWFFPYGATLERVGGQLPNGLCDCNVVSESPTCSNSSWNPCGPTATYWKTSPLDNGPIGIAVGWRLLHMTLPATGTTTGPQLQIKWQQIAAPRMTLDNSNHDDLGSSFADKRQTSSGYPQAVYGLRCGADFGLKVFQPERLAQAVDPANGVICPTTSNLAGYGESVPTVQALQPAPALQYRQVLTHLELELTGPGCDVASPCKVGAVCGGTLTTLNRVLYNHRCDIITGRDPSGSSVSVLAVAAGFPAVAPAAQTSSTSCPWSTYYGNPMIALYNVTNIGNAGFPAPRLLRIGLETMHQGDAFAIRTKTFNPGLNETSYAFVGDVTGRLLVFNVTWRLISHPASCPYLGNNQFLSPVATLTFPPDPYDGHLPNVIDLGIDDVNDSFLYCALTRGGVAVVDIADPTSPNFLNVVEILDTPGLALGIDFRTVSSGEQMIVGDSRCGIRLYQ
jgi:hypothetical protein